MQILCEVNQVECFRRGIDAPRSTIKIEVNPAKLPEDIRGFFADHLYDGYKLHTEVKLCRPNLMGLMEAVLAAKEYKEAKDTGRLPKGSGGHPADCPISFEVWIKGAGKDGKADREKLAEELTAAQEQSHSFSAWEEAARANVDHLQKAVKGAIEMVSKRK
jgi:hypothetical protein